MLQITRIAVALHCCRAHARASRKNWPL